MYNQQNAATHQYEPRHMQPAFSWNATQQKASCYSLDGGESQIGIPRVLKGIREGSSEPEWISNPRPDTFHLLLHSGKQELGKNYQADSDLTWLTDRRLRSNAAVPHIGGLLSAVSVEQMFDAQSKTSRSGCDLVQKCKRTAPPELNFRVLKKCLCCRHCTNQFAAQATAANSHCCKLQQRLQDKNQSFAGQVSGTVSGINHTQCSLHGRFSICHAADTRDDSL